MCFLFTILTTRRNRRTDLTKARVANFCYRVSQVVKFGWGPMGYHGIDNDVALVRAAREGLGPDIKLCVDAGTIWKHSATDALERVKAFAKYVS